MVVCPVFSSLRRGGGAPLRGGARRREGCVAGDGVQIHVLSKAALAKRSLPSTGGFYRDRSTSTGAGGRGGGGGRGGVSFTKKNHLHMDVTRGPTSWAVQLLFIKTRVPRERKQPAGTSLPGQGPAYRDQPTRTGTRYRDQAYQDRDQPTRTGTSLPGQGPYIGYRDQSTGGPVDRATGTGGL